MYYNINKNHYFCCLNLYNEMLRAATRADFLIFETILVSLNHKTCQHDTLEEIYC